MSNVCGNSAMLHICADVIGGGRNKASGGLILFLEYMCVSQALDNVNTGIRGLCAAARSMALKLVWIYGLVDGRVY